VGTCELESRTQNPELIYDVRTSPAMNRPPSLYSDVMHETRKGQNETKHKSPNIQKSICAQENITFHSPNDQR